MQSFESMLGRVGDRTPQFASLAARQEALARVHAEMEAQLPGEGRLVFGDGRANGEIALVGEAPGIEEEAQGKPFVGPAGRLLNRLLRDVSLAREDLWITNVVKRRPVPPGPTRLQTRAPSSAEIRAYRPWLLRELEIVGPRLIVCLGALTAKALIDPKFTLTKGRGTWRPGPFGAQVMATYHPAYIFRLGSPMRDELTEALREDLRKVKTAYIQAA